MRLEDLRVIVTGAASGLGLHFASQLAAHGATVAALDINAAGLCALESRCSGDRLRVYRVDVRQEAEVEAAVGGIVADLGRVNGLVNNAGIYRDGVIVGREGPAVRKLPVAQWRQVLDTDLTGPFLLTREVVAHMLACRVSPGVVVNVSSAMRHGNAGQSNYSAAKAGVAALTKVWAEELAPHGIRVATIAPGFIRTPMLAGTAPEVLEQWIRRVPLQRLGEPADVFAALRFAIECDFFTGKCIDVDGGLSV